jgi:hypothetical protein
MDETKKNIDETWKETVEKERKTAKEEDKFIPPELDFNFFITTLALQTSIALGQVPNPATNEKQEDLTQARFLIDTLGMLKEKTKNNLTIEETNLLENLLYELRMQYIEKMNKPKEEEQ